MHSTPCQREACERWARSVIDESQPVVLVIIREVLYSLNETVQLIVMHPMPGVGKSNYLNWTLDDLGDRHGVGRGPRFQTTN